MKKFSRAEDLLTQATKILYALGASQLEEKRAASLFGAAIVENSKAIILLLKSGFYSEAASVSRLSLEHLFNMGAILKNKNNLDKLKNHSKSEIPKQLGYILENHKKHPSLTPENLDLAQAYANDSSRANDPKNPGFNSYNAAEEAGLGFLYNSSYRLLSLGSAHSTYLSVVREITQSDLDNLLLSTEENLSICIAFAKENT